MQNISKSTIVAAVAASALSLSASGAYAVIASWSMATAIAAGTVGTSYNYGAADSGDAAAGSMLSSSHTAVVTAYSTPSGNGSTYSFSSNNWTAGNYYQVSVATTGYEGVSISWDQTRSSTGPSTFELVMSTNGGSSWSTLVASYAVVQAGAAGSNTLSWSPTGAYQTAFTTTASAAGAANAGNVIFRMRSLVTTTAAGTNRIDNVVVSGNMVPAPGAIALLGLAGLIGRRRR
ncbi:MAG: hypothetical protein EXS17_06475 [Phycisphaerales bacterium]|nr:hypothetical protein [Phycisphaerales bacterium]